MKTTNKLMAIIATLAFSAFAQAGGCDIVLDDPCAEDGYSIVEVEEDVYWPHNEMEAAHWTGYRLNHHKVRRVVHHRRYKARRVTRHHRASCRTRHHRRHRYTCGC